MIEIVNKNSGFPGFGLIMHPTSKKLRGHIGLGLSVCLCMHLSVHYALHTVES